MLNNFSSNAILAKSRAMYGKRLTESDYSALVMCKSVSDIASYLKQYTYYSKSFEKSGVSKMRRAELENILRQKLYLDFNSLCRYELSVGEGFAGYIPGYMEIQQILHAVLRIKAGNDAVIIFDIPDFLKNHMNYDREGIETASTYEELIKACAHSRYAKLLEHQLGGIDEPDFAILENGLYKILYNDLLNTAQRYLSGEAKQQMLELFSGMIDIQNYLRIVRLKKYYKSPHDYIRSFLISGGSLSDTVTSAMISSESADEAERIFFSTKLGRKLSKLPRDRIYERYQYDRCRHFIRYSVHPSVVLMSYIFLSGIELINIINITEGIRYQLEPDEIKSMLIYQ